MERHVDGPERDASRSRAASPTQGGGLHTAERVIFAPIANRNVPYSSYFNLGEP